MILLTNSLEKQVYIYSVDTSAFYNDIENKIHSKLLKAYRYRSHFKLLPSDYTNIKKHKKYISQRISKLKSKLHEEFDRNIDIRTIRNDSLKEKEVISIFDSVLTRTLGMKENVLTQDVIIVRAYHYKILKSIINNGFQHNNEKYVYFSSSAGQIRNKKGVFIKKSVWDEYSNTLTCGLSVEDINRQGGINLNKYQSYLALSNSASSEWKNFNIDRTIVVNDLETDVKSLVDYIDRDTYEITRQEMDIPIEHTDGCGMILPRKSKKSFMCRLPWVKGLLVPFDFRKFAEQNNSFIVKDVYGKEWDIVKDNIEVIFTKSQFKMFKYYDSWETYINKFNTYKCKAAKLNEEDTSNDAKINYQMLQTLTDMTNEELKGISIDTIEDIVSIGTDKDTMLRILGANEANKRKNHFQEALFLYNELLNDEYSKQAIKDKKKSLVKEAKSGKLNVNGKYTFLCPDLYAFCEQLFLGIESPNGILSNGEVYCRLYDNDKLDVLRSPHLYLEHCVRENVLDDMKKEWFITDGIYTSVKDPISKILQFDNDGDKALVIQDAAITKIAERNMKDVFPLYYVMSKAGAEEINSDSMYESLILAYKANIGEISNNITKIWNSDNVNLDVVKWLTMENNYTIDYAKTLYMPSRPDHVNEIISQYIKNKVPHFFTHAKDKEKHKVETVNNSVVNRLENVIPNKRINFTKIAGKFDYKMLMRNKRVKLDDEIIDTYVKLDRSKKWKLQLQEGINASHDLYIYKQIKKEILNVNDDVDYVVDVLVKYLHSKKSNKFKETLWKSFGDILIRNLKHNIEDTMQCECCGKRIKIKSSQSKYCENCFDTHRRIYKANKEKEYRALKRGQLTV